METFVPSTMLGRWEWLTFCLLWLLLLGEVCEVCVRCTACWEIEKFVSKLFPQKMSANLKTLLSFFFTIDIDMYRIKSSSNIL